MAGMSAVLTLNCCFSINSFWQDRYGEGTLMRIVLWMNLGGLAGLVFYAALKNYMEPNRHIFVHITLNTISFVIPILHGCLL